MPMEIHCDEPHLMGRAIVGEHRITLRGPSEGVSLIGSQYLRRQLEDLDRRLEELERRFDEQLKSPEAEKQPT